MRSWRVCLLVLLMLVLPLRGVMAVATGCASLGANVSANVSATTATGMPSAAPSPVLPCHAEAAVDLDADPDLGPLSASRDTSGHTDNDNMDNMGQTGHSPTAGSCSVCASLCASPPLRSAALVCLPAHEVGRVQFQGWATPSMPFWPDAQERPPRAA